MASRHGVRQRRNCSGWIIELTLEEVIAAYEVAAPKSSPERGLPWKKIDREHEG